MKRTGRVGYVDCAKLANESANVATNVATGKANRHAKKFVALRGGAGAKRFIVAMIASLGTLRYASRSPLTLRRNA